MKGIILKDYKLISCTELLGSAIYSEHRIKIMTKNVKSGTEKLFIVISKDLSQKEYRNATKDATPTFENKDGKTYDFGGFRKRIMELREDGYVELKPECN